MIKLDDVIEGLELDFDEHHNYYHVERDSIVMLTDDDIRYAEMEKDPQDAPEWRRDTIRLAYEFVDSFADGFISLPEKYEIDEYGMMEEFIETVEDPRLYNTLQSAIRGRGAFRRFKDAINHNNIDEKWYAYRDGRYKRIAAEWCEKNNIEYEKD